MAKNVPKFHRFKYCTTKWVIHFVEQTCSTDYHTVFVVRKRVKYRVLTLFSAIDLKKIRFVPGALSCTKSPTSCTWRKVVNGYKRNIVSLPKHHIRISRVFASLMKPIVRNTECDPLIFTTPVGATHCFLQHLQFYQNPAD